MKEPLLFVDLDAAADPALLDAARDSVAAAERILVGVRTREPMDSEWHDLLAALDLTLSPESTGPSAQARSCVQVCDPVAEASRLEAVTTANPQATLVLAQVLRAGQSLDVRAALDLESFAYSTLLGGEEFRRWLAARGARSLPPPVEVPPVLLERIGEQLRITLNRPERRNAYGRELRDAFVDGLRVAALDPTVVQVTIAGAGKVFSAGGDLDEFGAAPDAVTGHFVRTRGGAGELLHRLSTRTEARLHGACVGAGIELPAFAGRVVACPDTAFRLPEIAMGLIPGAGGTVSIPRRIGRWRTLHLALSGDWLDAATAVRWGLVDEIMV
ncbi:enoyl-CoA hydratase/isomerase family protein [Dactylosporangium sp. NPDC005572]|uniref:enoyl-CoA hydratase/isomerase family protein n=1 Tax=Dactylosporangium sp. NPDC005572 TaxID=3156889 RepID=UPI0033AC2AB7